MSAASNAQNLRVLPVLTHEDRARPGFCEHSPSLFPPGSTIVPLQGSSTRTVRPAKTCSSQPPPPAVDISAHVQPAGPDAAQRDASYLITPATGRHRPSSGPCSSLSSVPPGTLASLLHGGSPLNSAAAHAAAPHRTAASPEPPSAQASFEPSPSLLHGAQPLESPSPDLWETDSWDVATNRPPAPRRLSARQHRPGYPRRSWRAVPLPTPMDATFSQDSLSMVPEPTASPHAPLETEVLTMAQATGGDVAADADADWPGEVEVDAVFIQSATSTSSSPLPPRCSSKRIRSADEWRSCLRIRTEDIASPPFPPIPFNSLSQSDPPTMVDASCPPPAPCRSLISQSVGGTVPNQNQRPSRAPPPPTLISSAQTAPAHSNRTPLSAPTLATVARITTLLNQEQALRTRGASTLANTNHAKACLLIATLPPEALSRARVDQDPPLPRPSSPQPSPLAQRRTRRPTSSPYAASNRPICTTPHPSETDRPGLDRECSDRQKAAEWVASQLCARQINAILGEDAPAPSASEQLARRRSLVRTLTKWSATYQRGGVNIHRRLIAYINTHGGFISGDGRISGTWVEDFVSHSRAQAAVSAKKSGIRRVRQSAGSAAVIGIRAALRFSALSLHFNIDVDCVASKRALHCHRRRAPTAAHPPVTPFMMCSLEASADSPALNEFQRGHAAAFLLACIMSLRWVNAQRSFVRASPSQHSSGFLFFYGECDVDNKASEDERIGRPMFASTQGPAGSTTWHESYFRMVAAVRSKHFMIRATDSPDGDPAKATRWLDVLETRARSVKSIKAVLRAGPLACAAKSVAAITIHSCKRALLAVSLASGLPRPLRHELGKWSGAVSQTEEAALASLLRLHFDPGMPEPASDISDVYAAGSTLAESVVPPIIESVLRSIREMVAEVGIRHIPQCGGYDILQRRALL